MLIFSFLILVFSKEKLESEKQAVITCPDNNYLSNFNLNLEKFKLNDLDLTVKTKENTYYKSNFDSQLNSQINLDSSSLKFQTKYDRIIFYSENYIKITDSLFVNCKTKDNDLDSNGGAMTANIFSDPNSQIILLNVCYDKCYARGSGGAFFISSNTITMQSISVQHCQSQTSQSFSLFSFKSSTNLSSISQCGSKKDRKYKISKTITIGGSLHVFEQNNVSFNSVNGQCSFLNLYYFDLANISSCLFIKNCGETGFLFSDNGKNVILEKSYIYGNTFLVGPIFITKDFVEISKTWFEILKWNISDSLGSSKISFTECIFNAKKDEIIGFIQHEQISDCEYGTIDLPLIDEITVRCRQNGNNYINRDQKQPKKNDILSTKIYILIVLAFISGACAVYLLMTFNSNEGRKRKVHAFEVRYGYK